MSDSAHQRALRRVAAFLEGLPFFAAARCGGFALFVVFAGVRFSVSMLFLSNAMNAPFLLKVHQYENQHMFTRHDGRKIFPLRIEERRFMWRILRDACAKCAWSRIVLKDAFVRQAVCAESDRFQYIPLAVGLA